MGDDKWQRTITLWVVLVCLTALLCCWLLKPYRFQNVRGANGAPILFDRQTGQYEIPFIQRRQGD